jgi:hypothetical protein
MLLMVELSCFGIKSVEGVVLCLCGQKRLLVFIPICG